MTQASFKIKMKNHDQKVPRKMKPEDRKSKDSKPDYSKAREAKRNFEY